MISKTRLCTGKGLPSAIPLANHSLVWLHDFHLLWYSHLLGAFIKKNLRTCVVHLSSVKEFPLPQGQRWQLSTFNSSRCQNSLPWDPAPGGVCARRVRVDQKSDTAAAGSTRMHQRRQYAAVSNRGFLSQQNGPWPLVNINGNFLPGFQIFPPSAMHMPLPFPQFEPHADLHLYPLLHGRASGNHLPPQSPHQHHQQYRHEDRNTLKRKSSELDLSDTDFWKMGRYQMSEPLNCSRLSFNTSTSTSMHMKLVNGAKPILHTPGQPCERITEAIVQYYNDFHQSEADLKHKIVLSNCMYAIVRDIFPGCRLFIVGSSLSGFGTRTSDMDLCLLVSQMQDIDQKFEAVHILNAIHKSLKSCTFIKSSQVIKAKVPILKFRDSMKNIECDLNINNGVGIRNTHLLKYYCLSDTRVAPLMLFIKCWARFHDINDARKRTISSYSLALMLLHYLQVCAPPVVPCLQKLYPERFDATIDLKKLRLDEPLEGLSSRNTDSLGQLFQGFLDYYAFRFRPEFDVISIRLGRLMTRSYVQSHSKEPAQWKCLCIEEPFDLSNTARSVFDPLIFQRVRHVFIRSAKTLEKEKVVSALFRQPF